MYPKTALNKFIITNETDEYLEQLDWNYKLAVASSMERAQYFKSKRHFDVYSFTHPNQIHVYALKFLMRPNFPFANELNKFIEHATDGGLINKWRTKYQSHFKPKYQDETFFFKIENYLLIMVIFAHLIFLANFIFVLERIVFKRVQMRRWRRFWRFVEMMIDPDRHFLLKKYV